MAKEKMEEITPNAATAESGKSGGGMMPAIAVLVLMPVISFAITKFVFIPQIQSAVLDAAHQVSSADGSGHAAAGAAETAAASSNTYP
ncbi:MAG: hypothetical protein PHF70_14270, partial [Opitutales bacterium]|nr:hypothetical protein [Opitutales bacterium]